MHNVRVKYRLRYHVNALHLHDPSHIPLTTGERSNIDGKRDVYLIRGAPDSVAMSEKTP